MKQSYLPSILNWLKLDKTLKVNLLSLVILGLFFFSTNIAYSQCNFEVPRSFTTTNFDNLSVSSSTSGVCSSLLGCVIANESRLIDADETNNATASFGALGIGTTHRLRVTDGNTVYAAGSFAGFKIQPFVGLLNLDLLNGISIVTYLSGQPVESFSGASLLGLNVLSNPNDFIVGFNTSSAFDAIEIVFRSGVSALSSTKIYHAVLREYCAGPALNCNVSTKPQLPTFPVAINQTVTGISGLGLGTVANAENAINSDSDDFATLNFNLGVAATATFAIKNQVDVYPINTFAGFEIENSNLAAVGALGNVVIATYLNGILREQSNGSNLIANTGLLNTSGRTPLGFVASQTFNEVRLIINQTLTLNLGTTRIYGSVLQNFCAGPNLLCNTPTAMTAPLYPVFVNSANTGFDGVLCVGCNATNTQFLIDNDSSNFATINNTVGVGVIGKLAVKNQITDYPSGSFAGFDIETPALANVDALNGITIKTYLNGVVQETKSGSGALVAVGSNLLTGSGRQTLGFVTSTDYDEVQINFENTVAVSFGTIRVYNAVIQQFCEPTVVCDTTYFLSNPEFPVQVNSSRSGISGVVCVGCDVTNASNVVTADFNDFANITLVAGLASTGSIAVQDQLFTYPPGTFAGFVIDDLGTLAQVDLFQSLTISTYNNGILVESKLAANLIDLAALGINVLGSLPGVYNVGFKTSQEFDEVRISVNGLASVINSINVYGAFVNTSESNDGAAGNFNCFSASLLLTKDGTYNDFNGDGIVNVGDKIDYVFEIKNTSNESLTNVSLTDNNAVTSGLPIPSMPAGAADTNSYSAVYFITQQDIDAGVVYNLATITARTFFGSTVTATSTDPTPCVDCPPNPSCSSCTATALRQANTVSLVKTAVYNGNAAAAKVGDTITYTFTITNSGNTTLTNAVVTDAKLGLTNVSVSPSTLAPSESGTLTQNYTITQADIDAGSVTNSAVGTAQDPENNTLSDTSGTAVDNDDSTITNLPKNSSLALVKSAVYNGNATAAQVGDTITYTFTITNTGNTTLTNSVVTDAKLGMTNVAVSPSTLAPNASGTLTQNYTITQADIDAGTVTNSAVGSGTDPSNATVSDTSGTTTTNDTPTVTTVPSAPSTSSLALVKTAVYNGNATAAQVGDTITYTFTITNTGITTLSNAVITDAKLGMTNVAVSPSTLAPNSSGTLTQNYTITQADIDAGTVTNSAVGSATDSSNVTVSDTSGTTTTNDTATVTNLPKTSSVALVKTAVYNGNATAAQVGDTITYTFTITNTGNTTLNNAVVTDAKLGMNNVAVSPSTLAPSASGTLTQNYTITQSDIDAGTVTNSAVGSGTDPSNVAVSDTSGTTTTNDTATVTNLPKTSSVALVKTAVYNGNATAAQVGDTITYTFTITNTGNTTLSNAVVTDSKLGMTNVAVSPSTLAPSASGTLTQNYTITQSDIDAGTVTNSAVGSGTDPSNVTVSDTSGTTATNDTATVTNVPKTSSVALVKTAVYNGNATAAQVGDTITYTFTITNTGNTTLTNAVVTDAKLGLTNVALSPSTLAPNASGTLTQNYTITQADIDAGTVTNSATGSATDPSNATVSDTSGTTTTNDTATVTNLPKIASVALVKTAVYNGNATAAQVGDTITYTFTITNTGNTTLSSAVVSDAKLGMTNVAVSPGTLAPNASGTLTQNYTITQADIDSGMVTNSAVGNATDPSNATVSDTSGTTTTNDTPTVTTVPSASSTSSVALVKTAVYNGNATAAQVGDTITYTFTITNTGNTTLSNAVVSDTKLGMTNVAVSPSTLAPNASGTLTQNYTITQADINAGTVTNSAIGSATDPSNATVSDTSGTTTTNNTATVTNLPKIASVALVKTAIYNGNATAAQVGDTITYTFTITNTGNTTLSSAVVTDAKLGMTNVAVSPGTLAPNASGTLTQNYTITQADIDSGMVTNSAVGNATDPSNATVSDTSGTTTTNDTPTVTTVPSAPSTSSVALVKTAVYNGNATAAQVGDTITYTFTITNTGNTTLSNAVLTDTKLGMTNVAVSPGTLAPNASGTLTQNYTITQADIDSGMVTNSAVGNATDPSNATVSDTSGTTTTNNTATVTNLPKIASVALVKTAIYNGNATAAQVGDTITYTFTITNTSNTTLTNTVVTDAKLGMTNVAVSPSTLAPNASGTLTQSYTITQADIDAGSVMNSAIGNATDPSNATVSDISGTTTTNDSPTVTTVPSAPSTSSLALVKTAVYNGNASAAQVGDTITYTFTITNTGNTTLSSAVVSDAKLGMTNVAVSSSTLAPNASGTLTQNYTITQADIDAGSVTNSAIGSAIDPSNATVSDTSGTTTTNDTATVINLPKTSSVTLVKTAVYNGNAIEAQVGDTITYTFTITNTGNTTLTNAVVTDAKLGLTNVVISPSTLASNASGTLTQNYTITQADIDAGTVTNSAVGNATDPSNATVSDTSGTATTNDTATVTNLPKIASVALVKTAVYNGNATAAQVGDTITYTFTITNTGNTTLSNAVVTDAKLRMTNVAVSPSTLAPNTSGTLTQSYTITQGDINTGTVTNSAIGSATDPSNTTVSDTSGTTTTNDTATVTTVPKTASVALVKTAVYNGNAIAAQVGDTITYTFTITNTGNTTLTNAVITDAKLGMTNVVVSPSTLAPNASGILTQNYTITQADIDAGTVTNSAIGNATDASNATVSDTSGTTTTNDTPTVTTVPSAPSTSSVALVKTAVYNGNATAAQVGDTITYTFTITNTGNTTLSNAVVTDAKLGLTNVAVSPSTLEPNDSGTLTQNYTITQADIDAGSVTNSALGSATDASNATVSDTSGTTTTNDTPTVTNLPKTSSVALVKTAVYNGNATAAQVGDTITYTFTITNTGNTTLTNVDVTDAKLGMTNVAVGPSTLAPNGSGTLTQNYTITQADINAGSVTNSAIGSAKDPSNVTVSDTSGTNTTNDTPTVTTVPSAPSTSSVALVKTAVYNGNATAAQVGDTITYTFTITNTGNTTLTNAVVTDAKLGMNNVAVSPSTLAPNASGTLTQNYTITQADIDAGQVVNSALATGSTPQNVLVQDTSGTSITNDTPTTTILNSVSSISLLKEGVYIDSNNDGIVNIGDRINYTFTVQNTGQTTLSNVMISDLNVIVVGPAIPTLAVNATNSTNFSASYFITQSDISAGVVYNLATVTSTNPKGMTVTATSSDPTPCFSCPVSPTCLTCTITELPINDCAVEVFNAVSPNTGDDFERILYIKGIECYPNNTVQIFDRWGVKVFDLAGYNNTNKAFRGMSEGRVTIQQSSGLPTGTYFYVIDYTNFAGEKIEKTGYLHLEND